MTDKNSKDSPVDNDIDHQTNDAISSLSKTALYFSNATFRKNLAGLSLPPVPPTFSENRPYSPVTSLLSPNSKPTRLKSPCRTKLFDSTAEPFPSKSRALSLDDRKYAASLPDESRNGTSSPLAFFETNPYSRSNNTSQNENLESKGASKSKIPKHYRIHGKPSKHCKNKHLWARASLEREVPVDSDEIKITGSCASSKSLGDIKASCSLLNNKPTKIPCNCGCGGNKNSPATNFSDSHRHSSYHPNFGIGLTTYEDNGNSSVTAAAAAAAAAAYNAHMLFSRPTSPTNCTDHGESDICGCSSSRTLPRGGVGLSNLRATYCHCCRSRRNSLGLVSWKIIKRILFVVN